MTQSETNADQSNELQISRAKSLMAEALALLDDVGASLPAIYLDQALAALNDDTNDGAIKK